jgi:hypothetical protein
MVSLEFEFGERRVELILKKSVLSLMRDCSDDDVAFHRIFELISKDPDSDLFEVK